MQSRCVRKLRPRRPVSHIAGACDLSPITRYAHNALGQRVFKTEPFLPNLSGDEANPAYFAQLQAHWQQSWNPGTATNPQAAQESLGWAYLYSHGEAGGLGESTLLGEFGNGTIATGNTQHIYLPTPQGPLPVAAIIGGTRYATHADHLHTPRRLSLASNLVMWQWPYSAFGEEPPTVRKYRFANQATVNLGQTTSAAPTVYNLRFPGQHFDAESNLHYNHFRTYDPKHGRYTQSDPIGLLGGLNRFGYVGGNAFSFTDPEGLQVPGTWETIFRNVPPPIPNSPGVSIANPSSECVRDYLQSYYGDFVSNTLVPGFSAISYVPGSGYAKTAWQTTAISGGAKAGAALAVPAIGYYNMYAPGGSYNLGVNLVNGSKVAGGAFAVAGTGATTFATTAHTMAIAACSCRR